MARTPVLRAVLKLAAVLALGLAGSRLGPLVWAGPASAGSAYLYYWWGLGLLALVWLARPWVERAVECRAFRARIQTVLTGVRRERQLLFEAACAIRAGQEELALAVLEKLPRQAHPQVHATARWLRALAGVVWLKSQRRPVSPYRAPFPQINLVLFSAGRDALPVNRDRLARELERVNASLLDDWAREYLELADRLLAAWRDPTAPFHARAGEWLEFMAGPCALLRARARFAAHWARQRPVLCRGGGALLLGLRLLERGEFAGAAALLGRLEQHGALSPEADTVRRAAVFLVLMARPVWPLTPDCIPALFRDLHYCGWPETGLLRLPLAARPELAAWCARGPELRAAKHEFIEDLLSLWALFPHTGPVCAAILKRLLGRAGRWRPRALWYWRRRWERSAPDFEPAAPLLMAGVTAAAAGRQEEALHRFGLAALLQPRDPTALLNQAHVLAAAGRTADARQLAWRIFSDFPGDAGVCVALGQFFLRPLRDKERAQRFFLRAYELEPRAPEALLWLAEIALADGRYAEAEQGYQRASRADPGMLEARLGLGRLYLETGCCQLAIEHLLPVSRDGGDALREQAHYLLYRAYRELNADRHAIAHLDAIPPRFFEEPDELDDIAHHLEGEQQYAKARVFAERAMILRAQGCK